MGGSLFEACGNLRMGVWVADCWDGTEGSVFCKGGVRVGEGNPGCTWTGGYGLFSPVGWSGPEFVGPSSAAPVIDSESTPDDCGGCKYSDEPERGHINKYKWLGKNRETLKIYEPCLKSSAQIKLLSIVPSLR